MPKYFRQQQPRSPPLPRPATACSTAGILNNIPFLAGTAASMTATSLPAMLAGRGLAGLGAGAASVLVPRYLAEIAPRDIRGAVGTLTQAGVPGAIPLPHTCCHTDCCSSQAGCPKKKKLPLSGTAAL